MKNRSLLFLGMLFLVSCGNNDNKSGDDESTSTAEKSMDSLHSTVDQESESGSFTIKAKFIDFQLGDASHYSFEDESGQFWDFGDNLSNNFDFSQELDANESDEVNQGWGSNKELQGKWFLLTCVKREQAAYIDGPMVMVGIIEEAVLIE